jgi:mannosyl-3-phosphoglycerate phosphatase family protein
MIDSILHPVRGAQKLRDFILFTGVDGTLLDDETYKSDAAAAAIQQIAHHQIPLIFCSSKTFAEQENLQKKLGIRAPFIFENGSAIAIPQGYFPDGYYTPSGFSGDYDIIMFTGVDAYRVRTVVDRLNRLHGMGLRGFGDCPANELTALTHLTDVNLERARDRMFTEILVTPLNEQEAVTLNSKLAESGLALCKNARFNSIQSIGVDKGTAVRWLRQLYEMVWQHPSVTAAIGDSANDQTMLEAADIRFLVQRPGANWVPIGMKGLNYIKGVGPEGFSTVIRLLTA